MSLYSETMWCLELDSHTSNVSGIVLWTSTGPDPGAHYMLSSSEMSADFVLRQLYNDTVNRMMEDFFQKHPSPPNEHTNAEISGEQDLKSSSSSCSYPSAPYGILKTQLA